MRVNKTVCLKRQLYKQSTFSLIHRFKLQDDVSLIMEINGYGARLDMVTLPRRICSDHIALLLVIVSTDPKNKRSSRNDKIRRGNKRYDMVQSYC